MQNFTIDFNRLAGASQHKRLFTGRSHGSKAFEYFELGAYSKNDKLTLVIPSQVVVSSSYFLGLLEKVMKNYSTAEEFLAIVNKTSLSEDNNEEFMRAIKRGFMKSSSLL